ncbi:hypothetical protein FE257_002477 [Aspergillus nanangensis]|uniref:Uncharacterized protein n=1 Tax=Aspergillus nanangensis TaxID=2582783 RepID=A0AAD4CT39_ASPNN|nr:hypothetical protein FE257_002477 [Aspergillus nanangensis]
MSFSLLRNSLLRPARRLPAPYLARASYHPPETRSTKSEEFFMASAFPDSDSPTITQKRGMGTPTWDESQATASEADVKADRGDVEFRPFNPYTQEQEQERTERIINPDRMDPKIDEM